MLVTSLFYAGNLTKSYAIEVEIILDSYLYPRKKLCLINARNVEFILDYTRNIQQECHFRPDADPPITIYACGIDHTFSVREMLSICVSTTDCKGP